MFCVKCGNDIIASTHFCEKCGTENPGFDPDAPKPQTKVPPQQPQYQQSAQPRQDGMFMLTINKDNQFYVINPDIKVLVDGSATYKLANGTSIAFPVSAGRHVIKFSACMRKREVEVDIFSDVVLNVSWDRMTGALIVK